MKRITVYLSSTILLFVILLVADASSNGQQQSLPRSIPRSNHRRSNHHRQPWNPSSRIDEDGFLKDLYERIHGEWEAEVRPKSVFASSSLDLPVRIRQVPGDGNCLFHSISLCLCHAVNGTHWKLQGESLDSLYHHSRLLRQKAVACLKSRRRLFLQGRESLKAPELVQAAAQQYGLTAQEYCEAMQQESVWGGGPEIVALCNILQRPIHVYELATCGETDEYTQSKFILRRMACFGSPKFDKRPALHILSADSRFPDVSPGCQLSAGNHFLAVFPCKRKKRLRGGGYFYKKDEEDNYYYDEEDEDDVQSRRSSALKIPEWMRWWHKLFLLRGSDDTEED